MNGAGDPTKPTRLGRTAFLCIAMVIVAIRLAVGIIGYDDWHCAFTSCVRVSK